MYIYIYIYVYTCKYVHTYVLYTSPTPCHGLESLLRESRVELGEPTAASPRGGRHERLLEGAKRYSYGWVEYMLQPPNQKIKRALTLSRNLDSGGYRGLYYI